MNANNTALLRQLAIELPRLARQTASSDANVRTAGILRLQELSALLAPFLAAPAPQRTASRRSVLKVGAGVFAGWAIKEED